MGNMKRRKKGGIKVWKTDRKEKEARGKRNDDEEGS